MANQHHIPRANQNNSPRSPELESLLTLKKQAQHQADIARRNLADAERALEAAEEGRCTAQAIWQEYCDAYHQWQTARQITEAVKTGETKISEFKYRILCAGALALGMLILAAIQVTPSSMLVVILLGVLPCLIYLGTKARQLLRAQRSLPDKDGVGDPTALEKVAQKWRQRYERARAAAQRTAPDHPILVARVQQAQKDLADWEFKGKDAEVRIQARISLERARKPQH